MFEEMEFLQGRHEIRMFYQKINKGRREFKLKTNMIKKRRQHHNKQWKRNCQQMQKALFLTNEGSQQNPLSEQQNTTEDEDPLHCQLNFLKQQTMPLSSGSRK